MTGQGQIDPQRDNKYTSVVDKAIHQVPIFAGLSSAALDCLLANGKTQDVGANEIILHEGEPGNRFFLIEEGSVRVVKHIGLENETELARLRQGEFFGEMCILETLPRSATVQAITSCRLFHLAALAFLPLYEQMPEQYSILVLNLARDLSRRLRKLDEAFAARH